MRRVVFHSFNMGDVEDPELYASLPLGEFMTTEKGQWIKDHCADPRYVIRPWPASWGNKVIVYGEVSESDAVFYELKWGSHDQSLV